MIVASSLFVKWGLNESRSQGAHRFADVVKEATNSELEIILHPGAALGLKGPELLRPVTEGQLIIAEVPIGMLEGDAPADGSTLYFKKCLLAKSIRQ